TDAEALIEFAGRGCYQSWGNPSGKTNREYVQHLCRQGHFSVLEHANITVAIRGVSRAFTHELVRHRHFSYSQLSQRFVDESEARFVIPPAIRQFGDSYDHRWLEEAFKDVLAQYRAWVEDL